MYFTLERVTPPDGEPVDLASMKRHLRTFTSATDEDADITAHITAAREWVEDYTGRALLDQTWKLTLQGRPGSFAGGDIVGGTRDGRAAARIRLLRRALDVEQERRNHAAQGARDLDHVVRDGRRGRC
jgi:hypothetical protein